MKKLQEISRRQFFGHTAAAAFIGAGAQAAAWTYRSQAGALPPGTSTGWGVPGASRHIHIGSRRQLLWDDFLLSRGSAPGRDYPINVTFNVGKVEKDQEPVMLPGRDAPWEKTGMYWMSILHDGGRYRCWYNTTRYTARLPEYPHQRPVDSDSVVHMMVAYAESDDGITWRKPILNQIDIDGSKANNLVFLGDTDRYTEGAVVFIDPSAAPQEQYKMIFASRFGLQGASSSDGLSWTLSPKIMEVRGLDTQNVAWFDPVLHRYVAYIRSNSLNYGGLDVGSHPVAPTSRGRAVARLESLDFRDWSLPEIVLAPDIADGLNTDFYNCPGSAYEGVYLMPFSPYYHWKGNLNLQLAVSRDNRNWVRPTRAIWVDNGGPGDYDEFRIYAAPGVFPAGKDRLAIFTRTGQGPHPGAIDSNYQPGPWKTWAGLPEGAMGRVVFPRDRVVGIEAGETEGVFATRELVFDGKHLRINAEPIGRNPELRVQIVQGQGRESKALSSFTFEDSVPLTEDQLEGTARWTGGTDLAELSGKPVRLHFRLKSMRIYGFQFLPS